MIFALHSAPPGPRVGAISPPPLGGGSGAKRVAGDPRHCCWRVDSTGYRAPGLTRGLVANWATTPEAPGQARGAGCVRRGLTIAGHR